MDEWMGGGWKQNSAGEKIAKKEERGEDGRRNSGWKAALIYFNFSQLFPSFPSFFSAHKKILFFPARTKKQASKH
jgi:hypothetical protein